MHFIYTFLQKNLLSEEDEYKSELDLKKELQLVEANYNFFLQEMKGLSSSLDEIIIQYNQHKFDKL